MIARNFFRSTSGDKKRAEDFVVDVFRSKLLIRKDSDGYVNLQGLKIGSEEIMEIPQNKLNTTINVLNNYMAYITKRYGEDGRDEASTMKEHRAILYIAYVGIALSVMGLLITVCSICSFRKLRKFRGNQILVHICLTVMAGMILSLLSFTYEGKGSMCVAMAMLLHYFILAALSWMCVEAYNLYRDLVKVFNTSVLSTRTFLVRACVFAYGLPALVVGVSAMVDLDIYGHGNEACWMTTIAFLISLLGPVLSIMLVNVVFFTLIMREIVQVSQRDARTIKPSLHAAVSLSVLLGFCWVFAGISTFSDLAFFQYAFVVSSSFQGFFVFLFHGIGKKELRDSWKSLAIFNWRFYSYGSSVSNGKAKTESTRDAPQLPAAHTINIQVTKTKDKIESESVEKGSKKMDWVFENKILGDKNNDIERKIEDNCHPNYTLPAETTNIAIKRNSCTALLEKEGTLNQRAEKERVAHFGISGKASIQNKPDSSQFGSINCDDEKSFLQVLEAAKQNDINEGVFGKKNNVTNVSLLK